MKTQIKFIEKTSRKGFQIGKAFYSKKTMQLSVLESNIILNNIDNKLQKNI